jgi:hypothetical protein
VIRTLQDLRRDQIDRPLPGKHNERSTRRLFVRQGRVLSNAYLFDDALLTACRTAGLLDAEGKPTITAHRSHRRNPAGRTRRPAPDDHERLGTQECADGLVYAHVSDPTVFDATAPCSAPTPPSPDHLRRRSTPKYALRLRDRYAIELELDGQARAQGWTREVGRHESVARRIRQLLADLNEPPALDGQTPPAGPAA